jgi:hypothetical protein
MIARDGDGNHAEDVLMTLGAPCLAMLRDMGIPEDGLLATRNSPYCEYETDRPGIAA